MGSDAFVTGFFSVGLVLDVIGAFLAASPVLEAVGPPTGLLDAGAVVVFEAAADEAVVRVVALAAVEEAVGLVRVLRVVAGLVVAAFVLSVADDEAGVGRVVALDVVTGAFVTRGLTSAAALVPFLRGGPLEVVVPEAGRAFAGEAVRLVVVVVFFNSAVFLSATDDRGALAVVLGAVVLAVALDVGVDLAEVVVDRAAVGLVAEGAGLVVRVLPVVAVELGAGLVVLGFTSAFVAAGFEVADDGLDDGAAAEVAGFLVVAATLLVGALGAVVLDASGD